VRIFTEGESFPDKTLKGMGGWVDASHIKQVYQCTIHMGKKNVINALSYPKFQCYIFALGFGIMLVCNIQQTIRMNTVGPGKNTWMYGQILAVAATVVPPGATASVVAVNGG
jgi:hypothetical protein